VNGLALCAGIGGIELAAGAAIPGHRTVGYVEREAYAACTLVARMGHAALDRAPVWDSLETFSGLPWRGRVDLLTAGFPCQPWSSAGRRRGTADARWLWPDIARILCEVGPAHVFLENVPGILYGGIGHILGTLASLGYDAEWCVFSAAAAGSPQRRRRWFCLAYAGGGARGPQPRRRGREGRASASVPGDDGAQLVAHGHRARRTPDYQPGGEAGHTDGSCPPAWPPGPDDPRWPAIIEQHPDLCPGLPAPAESQVCGVADGVSPGVDDDA